MALFIQLRQIEKSCIAKHAQILFHFFALRPDRHSNDGPSRCPLRWEPLSSRVSLVLTNCYDIKINMISMRNSKIINATEMKILPQQNNYEEISIKLIQLAAAAIAPWYCLSLPSCSRRFESQAHHLGFINLYYWNCNEKRTKINKKRPGSAHFLNINWVPQCFANCGQNVLLYSSLVVFKRLHHVLVLVVVIILCNVLDHHSRSHWN